VGRAARQPGLVSPAGHTTVGVIGALALVPLPAAAHVPLAGSWLTAVATMMLGLAFR
jgi:hypothetical protein